MRAAMSSYAFSGVAVCACTLSNTTQPPGVVQGCSSYLVGTSPGPTCTSGCFYYYALPFGTTLGKVPVTAGERPDDCRESSADSGKDCWDSLRGHIRPAKGESPTAVLEMCCPNLQVRVGCWGMAVGSVEVTFAGGLCSHEKRAGTPTGMLSRIPRL